LSDFVNRVAYRSESFIVTRGRKAIAELRAVSQARTLRDLPELLASLPHLTPEEAADFENDIAEARAALSKQPLGDAWDT
jgi:hypothetical protein